jgi:Pyridoxamine 5'-phosphate oxidase
MAARLTTEQVWHQVAKASFAVLSHVTPAGEPRSSGVLYKTIGRRLYIAVAPDSWKARHVAASGRVAVTVPVRRGGLLSLVAPIPPATISFHANAIVHQADSPQVRSVLKELASLLPAERQASARIIEVIPEGCFVTYGVDVSLTQMRDPVAARARVPVTQEESAQ